MMIQHCKQSWEESKRIIGYGPPPTAATQTTHHIAGPTQQTETGPGAPFTPSTPTTTVRKLNMEHPQLDSHSAKERDPELNRTEAKGGLDHNPRTQAPAQGREKGQANDRQKTHTTITDPQSGTTKQGASSRGKSTKSRDPDSTGPPLQTEADKGTTRPKQTTPQPHLPDGSPYRSDDTLTNGTTGLSPQKEEIKPSIQTKETLNSQAVTELNQKPDQTERIAVTGIDPPPAHLTHPESEWELLLGSNAQGQDGPRLGPQPETMDTAEPTLLAPSVPGKRRKGHPVANGSTQSRVISTLLSDDANAALPDAPKHVPTGTKDDGPVPTLTQVQIHSWKGPYHSASPHPNS